MKFKRYFIITVLLSFPFFANIAPCRTYVGGPVSGTWTKENSPYLVTENITIEDNHSLIIRPGVHIYFYDSVKFTIGKEFNTNSYKHQLIAKGSKTDSIVMAAHDPVSGWGGIKFIESSNDDTIDYAIIKDIRSTGIEYWSNREIWGKLSRGAIDISYSSPQIHRSSIKNNQIGNFALFNCYEGNPQFSNCIITNNKGLSDDWEWGRDIGWGYSAIFNSYGSSILIENTLIYNNLVGQFYNNADGSLFTFINNTISQNTFFISTRTFDWRVTGLFKKIYFINSIITDNISDFNSLLGYPSTGDSILFYYSNIDTSLEFSSFPPYWEGEDSWLNNPNITWKTGNISLDPLFTDAEHYDFTLQPTSPCVDAGNPNKGYNDIEDPDHPGQALWPAQGSIRNDMGAFGGKSTLDPESTTNVVINQDKNLNPDGFTLGNNAPNPFNPQTTIEYQLPSQENVIITIYNTLGERIKILVNSDHSTGLYRTLWDGKDQYGRSVSSGVYFYRMDAGPFHQVKPMMLIK